MAERQRARNYYRQHKEQVLVRHKAYYKAHPEKTLARIAVAKAKRKGLLKIQPCADCGVSPSKAKIQAHHEDYSKPLDVIWLCPMCHRRRECQIDFKKAV